jgi:TolB-like protein
MKKHYLSLILLFITTVCYSQTIKFAIVDFDNISGNVKYDGLGKAMSSMLISDLTSSNNKIQIVERAQINKLLKEQNFQKSSSVDKNSTVQIGKLLGVKYLLVGDIYVLNDELVINARLTDVESGDIKFSNKQEGKLQYWLNLKTGIAKEISKNLALPLTNKTTSEFKKETLVTFGDLLNETDKGNLVQAQELLKKIETLDNDFAYLNEIKIDIKKLNDRINSVESVVKNIDSKLNDLYSKISEAKIINKPTTTEEFLINARVSYQKSSFKEAEVMYVNLFNSGYIKLDLAIQFYETIYNNYDGDEDKINLVIDKLTLEDKTMINLAKLLFTHSGMKFYRNISNAQINNDILKAYVQNIKAKSFYSDVQYLNQNPNYQGFFDYWTYQFYANHKKMGIKLIKIKNQFFDYNQAVKDYYNGTSYGGGDPTVFDFYMNGREFKEELMISNKVYWVNYLNSK